MTRREQVKSTLHSLGPMSYAGLPRKRHEGPGGAHPVQFNFWGELFTPQWYCPADWGRCCGTVSLWGLWMQGQDFFLPDSHFC